MSDPRRDTSLPSIARGAALHEAGQLDEAADVYRQILAGSPRDFDAMHLLGVIALQRGQFDIAQRMIGAALVVRPNDTGAIGNLGISYLRDGQLLPALQWFEIALQLQPDSAVSLLNAGEAMHDLGRPREAIARLRKACALDPSSYEAHRLLGACLLGIADPGNAASVFETATRLHPQDAEAWANLSLAAMSLGQHDRARACADRAAHLEPDSAPGLDALAKARLKQAKTAEAIERHERGVSPAGPSVDMLLSFANALLANGLNDAALEHLQHARALDPHNPTVRWALALGQLKTVYASESEVSMSREKLAEALDEIKRWSESGTSIEAPHAAVGTVQGFLLAYQNDNNLDLLKRYGALCAAFMSTLPMRPPAPPPDRGGGNSRKLRLGIVSAHIREHSVWIAVTKGWVQHLDRNLFEIEVFHLSGTVDHETLEARRSVDHFDAEPKSASGWAEAIAGRRLDVILYPEIGSDSMTVKLASLRLAPVQAVSWGHPETSGLPTMDLYFSAQAFEPPDAQRCNYSERLIALPHLSVYVEPLDLPNTEPDFRALNLPQDELLLVCPGQPFKYAPRYDDVWVGIAKGLEKKGLLRTKRFGRLVFFRSHNETWDRLFERRLRAAFERQGVGFDAHVTIVPFLEQARFFGLLRRAALMLDTLGFSGFNTALQGIECGLPVLAFESGFMRGRLASGIMRELDLPDLVASTPSDFVSRAVALVRDPGRLASLRSKIEERRESLFRNLAPVRALEATLLEATRLERHR